MPFNYISSSFFIHSWYDDKVTDYSLHKAGEAMGLPFLISAFIVPILSYAIDFHGKRAILITFSAFLALITFILFLTIDPIYGLFCFGISFSVFAAVVWPAITLVVPTKLIGFALGLTTSLQNTSMAIFPLIVAFIYTKTNSYTNTLFFFVFISSISCVLALIIKGYDSKMEGILDRADPDIVKDKLIEKKESKKL